MGDNPLFVNSKEKIKFKDVKPGMLIATPNYTFLILKIEEEEERVLVLERDHFEMVCLISHIEKDLIETFGCILTKPTQPITNSSV